MQLHWGDLTDSSSLVKVITEVKPDEIYNLGAQSHVKVMFQSCWGSITELICDCLVLLTIIVILRLTHSISFTKVSFELSEYLSLIHI